jgi:ketosteroid isomerase-like protein
MAGGGTRGRLSAWQKERDMSAGDVIRALYDALAKGDVPGVMARLDPDVIVDEPRELPYGGVHRGRDVFVQSILGAMMGYANVEITEATVIDNAAGVVGILTGTLTAHASGEQFPLTMVELHEVVGEVTRKIDVYTKDPAALAAFYARAGAASG